MPSPVLGHREIELELGPCVQGVHSLMNEQTVNQELQQGGQEGKKEEAQGRGGGKWVKAVKAS